MNARSQALVPLSTEQQAAWRAVAETEKRRHQGNTLAEYPYAGAFFRCLNGSRRISLSDLRFFMPSLTAEELRGNRSQWLYAVDVLIETQGEVCLLPLPGDAAEQLFPSVRFRVRERSRHKSALVMQKYSRQQAREAEQKTRAYQALVAQAEIELAFHSPPFQLPAPSLQSLQQPSFPLSPPILMWSIFPTTTQPWFTGTGPILRIRRFICHHQLTGGAPALCGQAVFAHSVQALLYPHCRQWLQ